MLKLIEFNKKLKNYLPINNKLGWKKENKKLVKLS
jgi:hypothetical protein